MIDYEGNKDIILSGNGRGETMESVMKRRFSRRAAVVGAAAAVTLGIDAASAQTPGASPDASPAGSPAASPAAGGPKLAFDNLGLQGGEALGVPKGYTAVPFLRWGDPVFADAPEFDLTKQTAAAQEKQFGYNCDWIGWISLPQGEATPDNGLLCVNHEYTNPELMFKGYLTPNPEYNEKDEDSKEFIVNTSKEIVDTELAAHGLTVIELKRTNGAWEPVLDSKYNRRITATTPMELTGPVMGTEWVKTKEDATGAKVVGTLNNCAGGTTPWGTIISGEENFHQYFANGETVKDEKIAANHKRFGLPEKGSDRLWETVYDRFDLAKEPNEPFRFGWPIEIDPLDPTSTPKKRTAMGRNKHEGHTSLVAPSGHVVVYSGDDERFEYAYKFVSEGTYDEANRDANLDILDKGTLYVAKFNDDGSGEWLPLTHGENGLDEAAGFASQADVLINTRAAADILGATKMDRPEDFETNPVNQKVYLVCTNNTKRGTDDKPKVDAANPRPENSTGHIIEITEAGDDHAATTFKWDIFLLAGDPEEESSFFAGFPKDKVSPIASPDNITFDTVGNIWISTDGLPNTFEGMNDGLFATAVEGSERGNLKQFFSTVVGAECSGPVFNSDCTALFTSVQHPGEGGTLDKPITMWPDGEGTARPTVVLITKDDKGVIGQ